MAVKLVLSVPHSMACQEIYTKILMIETDPGEKILRFLGNEVSYLFNWWLLLSVDKNDIKSASKKRLQFYLSLKFLPEERWE